MINFSRGIENSSEHLILQQIDLPEGIGHLDRPSKGKHQSERNLACQDRRTDVIGKDCMGRKPTTE